MEKSKSSFVKLSSFTPEVCIISNFSLDEGSFISFAKILEYPIIGVSGVRISWLILAKNSFLALFADSAISFEILSSLVLSLTLSSKLLFNSFNSALRISAFSFSFFISSSLTNISKISSFTVENTSLKHSCKLKKLFSNSAIN